MRDSFINDIHLNIFKKYSIKRGHKKHNQVKENLKNNNSIKGTIKDSTFFSENIKPNTTSNFFEDKKSFESPIKTNKTYSKQMLTPIQKIRQKFYKTKKKNESNNNSIIESFSPLKNKFSLNNIVNSYLFKIYLDKSYKKVLYRRLDPYKEKEKNIDIKMDLKILQHKGGFYIPIKKRKKESNKREIGIQSSMSYKNNIQNNFINHKNFSANTPSPIITEDKSDIKLKDNNNKSTINEKKNFLRLNSVNKKQKNNIMNNSGINFNKYDLINKKLVNNFEKYSQSCKKIKYDKVKKVVSSEKKKIDKILNKLKFEQYNDKEKLKFELSKFNGYIYKKNKKNNNNSYNLFL